MALLDRLKRKQKEEKASAEREMGVEEKSLKSQVEKKTKEATLSKTASKKTVQAYRFILEPHITEKATYLTGKNKYVFLVSRFANKPEIKKAVESLYDVRVKNVNLIHLPAKKRRLGRSEGWKKGLKKGIKKAVVTLEKGDKIEVLPR